jgi:hypothetical protein
MKIQAKELRIGNYYNLHTSGSDEWGVITPEDIVDLANDPLDDYFKPIPLTEEWFNKLGFEDEYCISHKDEYFNLTEVKDGYCFTADLYHHTGIPIKYVHQLQNLYFALTGKELTTVQDEK